MDILIKMLLAVGLTGVVGGPYVFFVAQYRPRTFVKPGLAKRQGLIAFGIGLAIFAVYIFFLR